MSPSGGRYHRTARDKLFSLLADRRWHTHSELLLVAGARYGARLLELKRLGYKIESQELSGSGKRYRLTTLVRGEGPEKRVKVFLRLEDARTLLRAGELTREARQAIADALVSYLANAGKL